MVPPIDSMPPAQNRATSDYSDIQTSSLSSSLSSIQSSILQQDDGPVEDKDIDVEAVDVLLRTAAQRTYRQRVSTENKLQEVVNLLQNHCQWSLKKFLLMWVGSRGNEDVIIQSRQYSTAAHRRAALLDVLEGEEFREACEMDNKPIEISTIRAEFNALICQPYFGRSSASTVIEDVDFTAAMANIRTVAPTWYAIITALLQNQRAHRGSGYSSSRLENEVLPKRVFMVTTLVCYSRSRGQSSFFQSMLSLYLQGSGTKRRVVDVLAGLGVCQSYYTGNRMMTKIAKEAKRKLRQLAHDPQAVVVYDNMNFKDNTRHEITGHAATMRAVTTAAIVVCPEMPPSGLLQSMHNPRVPLSVHDIFTTPAISGDALGVQISTALIASAIRDVHTQSVEHVFSDEEFPGIPVIQTVQLNKTAFYQFGAIFEDEGTIDGTYGVHTNIFLDQLRLRAPSDLVGLDDFKDRLWLAHGDQLTAQRIRTVKSDQMFAVRPFDRKDWLLGIPAWFHIQMNLLYTIVRTHWGPSHTQEQAHHCVKADCVTWGRSHYGPDNIKYHLVEPLVRQGFSARVLALFYQAMSRKGLLADGDHRMEDINVAIRALSSATFHDLVEDVRVSAFTLAAWEGREHKDIEFRTMCRMLQEIELFLTVRHAVKHGDVGMLRRMVDPLIVAFFGAAQHNYGREMLFYRWNLSNGVNSPELQHAILASGLVNWGGKAAGFKPIDLSLEHLNCNCKTEMNCYKNSTRDVDTIFDRVCLSNTTIREIRDKLEGFFGTHMPDDHTTTSAALDIFSLARTLVASELCGPRTEDQLHGTMFDSEDIFQKGMDMLADRVDAFNHQHVRTANSLLSVQPTPAIDEKEQHFVDINEYVAVVDDVVEQLDLTDA